MRAPSDTRAGQTNGGDCFRRISWVFATFKRFSALFGRVDGRKRRFALPTEGAERTATGLKWERIGRPRRTGDASRAFSGFPVSGTGFSVPGFQGFPRGYTAVSRPEPDGGTGGGGRRTARTIPGGVSAPRRSAALAVGRRIPGDALPVPGSCPGRAPFPAVSVLCGKSIDTICGRV